MGKHKDKKEHKKKDKAHRKEHERKHEKKRELKSTLKKAKKVTKEGKASAKKSVKKSVKSPRSGLKVRKVTLRKREKPIKSRTIKVEKKVLDKNDHIAQCTRDWLHSRAISTLNFISSPGSGKTMLLEKTLEMLTGRVPCAVIVGDQQTDNDAKRLSGKGAEVRQIETGHTCHLDAERVEKVLPEVIMHDTRLLFIENVGNLICPGAFDLGEDRKVVLLSVAEGEDKPLKYPSIFARAEVVILTKTDLAPHVEWDRKLALQNIRKAAPGAYVFELSAKTGEGMERWVDYLLTLDV